MSRQLSLAVLVLLAIGVLSIGCQQQAAAYPTQPIEFTSATTAGSAGDILPRTVADILTKEKIVSQPISVVNKAGGAGNIGMAYVAERKGDPHYLLHTTSVHLSTPLTQTDAVSMKEMTPVANLVSDVDLICVQVDGPYKTLMDVVNASKAGTKITWGGGSVTASDGMNLVMINKNLGSKFEHLSFSGGGQAAPALMGGHVQIISRRTFEIGELVKTNKVRAVATSSPTRLKEFPDVPTLKELGVPDFVSGSMRGFAMPAGVPKEAVTYWQNAFKKMLETDSWKKYFAGSGLIADYMDGATFDKYLAETTTLYEGIVKQMGLAPAKK